MTHLCDDIIGYIYDFLPIDQKLKKSMVCKSFFDKSKKDYNRILNIQRFYKKNKIDDNLEFNNKNRLLVYRYYIAKYDNIYLKKYPEFLTNKAIINEDKKQNCLNWIKNNLNSNNELRTRRDIYNFFFENNITPVEISIAGW